VYSSRDYTRQQMALLQQQADREGAYAQRRGALMADRWKGLGGLATETLASLVQSRDLRDAKAEAQRRYDAEQARLVAEDARVAEADRVNAANRLDQLQQRRATQIREDVGVAGTLTDEQAAAMEAARPGSTEAFTSPAQTSPTLASVNRPPSQMGDRAFQSVRFGEDASAPRPDGLAGTMRNTPRPPSTWLGPALVAGTSETPATSGTRMRMTGAQGKALEKDVAMRAAIQSLVSSGSFSQEQADFLKENPDLPPQAWATVFPAPRPAATPRALPSTLEGRAVQLLAQADAEPDPAKRAALRGLAKDALVSDRAQRQSSRATAPAKGEALPPEVQSYLVSLKENGIAPRPTPGIMSRSGVAPPSIPPMPGARTGSTYAQASSEIRRAWPALIQAYPNLSLLSVQRVMDALWPLTKDEYNTYSRDTPESELEVSAPEPRPAGDPLKLRNP